MKIQKKKKAILLVGNKTDKKREVTTEEVQKFVLENNGVLFEECCARGLHFSSNEMFKSFLPFSIREVPSGILSNVKSCMIV